MREAKIWAAAYPPRPTTLDPQRYNRLDPIPPQPTTPSTPEVKILLPDKYGNQILLLSQNTYMTINLAKCYNIQTTLGNVLHCCHVVSLSHGRDAGVIVSSARKYP